MAECGHHGVAVSYQIVQESLAVFAFEIIRTSLSKLSSSLSSPEKWLSSELDSSLSSMDHEGCSTHEEQRRQLNYIYSIYWLVVVYSIDAHFDRAPTENPAHTSATKGTLTSIEKVSSLVPGLTSRRLDADRFDILVAT